MIHIVNATDIAILIGGLAQPYVQEFIIKNRLDGRGSLLATAAAAFLIAALATWLLGGFAHLVIPAFSLADPSPLLAYFIPRFAEVFALSQLVFSGTRDTKADVHEVAKTTPTP